MSHHLHPTILREYDIRGIVGQTLSSDDARLIGRSFGTCVRRAGGQRIAVGRDGRLSSPDLEDAFVAGAMASGCHVTRVGCGPTPMLYWATHALEMDGGVQITGSHNPPDHNGFKMVLQGAPFYGEAIARLDDMVREQDWESGTGTQESVDIIDDYVARLLLHFSGASFRIAWDAGNGAAGEVVERLTARLPGEHILLHTRIDGHFPNHHPDPTEEKNLQDVRRAILDNGLDFGIAFDGDGDRIGVVDGKGRTIWGDQLLSILATDVLSFCPGATIIADVKASQSLFDHIAAMGGHPVMWKTGHSLIKTKMKELNAPLAGEMSGHVFFAHDYYGFDDALYAAVRLIDALARQDTSLAALKDAMPPLVNTPEIRIDCSEERKFAVIAEVLDRLRAEQCQIDETDGARVKTADGWWLLRASNTQAALVARAESQDAPGLKRLIAMIESQLARSGIDVRLTESA